MKKRKISLSRPFYPSYLEYRYTENPWKCSFDFFYKINENEIYAIADIYFSEKGIAQIGFCSNKELSETLFELMKKDVDFQFYFEKCKKVIESIQHIVQGEPDCFRDFDYDFETKVGTFKFEIPSIRYIFTLTLGEGIGMNKIQIVYEDVQIIEFADSIFGEKGTNVINELIKKKLRLKYFF